MKNILRLSLIVLTVIGCNTLKKDQRNMQHIQAYHPDLLTAYCANNFAPKTDTVYTKGKDSVVHDTRTIYTNCDSVLLAYLQAHPNATQEEIQTVMQYVPVPYPLIDTVYRVDTARVGYENTAKIELLNKTVAALQAKNEKLTKARNVCAIVLAIEFLIIAGFVYALIKSIKK
jgi:hypothetical protein